ncbi:hypothetical protein ACQPXS_02085 [Streptomyces sp. CA-142005]|uniref:hypothetical protein n=1 Tax=Streptomyces sp. CA-142005 TaxID=3240052 RepID=UPI003D931C38
MSIWTLDGRLKNVQFACSPGTLKQLAEHRKGETDLIARDGKLFLLATIDMPEPEVFEPKGFIGVDRDINNLATTSDGDNHSGRVWAATAGGRPVRRPKSRPNRPGVRNSC